MPFIPLRRLTLLLVLSVPIMGVGQNQESPLVLDHLGRMAMPIDGAWQFHTGDNPAWASPSFDDSAWQPIAAGRSWEGQGHRGYTGFAWYRRHIVVPPGMPANLNLALWLPGVEDAAEIYWNGKLVGTFGRVPPHPVWSLVSSPQAHVLGPARSGVLAIRVWSAPIIYLNSAEQGGLSETPQIGTSDGVAALQTADRYRWLVNNQYNLALCAVCAIVGLLALFSWLRDRTEWVLLWLAFPMLMPVVSLITFNLPGVSTFRLAYGSIGEEIALSNVSIWFLLLYMLDLRSNARLIRWTKILAATTFALTLVDTIMVWLDWTRLFPRQFLYLDIASTIPIELLELYVIVIVAFALRKHLDRARWMLAIASVVSALNSAVTDISGLGNRWTHWTLEQKLSRPLFAVWGSLINLRTLIELFLLISILYAAWRYSLEQKQRKSALEQEFLSAQEIQQVLIPEALPTIAGYSLTSAYIPAHEVGGDFFQIIPLAKDTDNQSAIVVLGDVSGKGLKAAMTVSLLVGAICSTVESTQDPAQILTALNRRLHGRLRNGFATCLVLRLDEAGSCAIANAGHLPPFLNGNEFPLPAALPLGLLPEADYQNTAMHLAPGDRLVLYTDGLLEARNRAGELFGFARIGAISDNTSEEIAEAAQQFGQDDDITVLTFTVAPRAVHLAGREARATFT